MAIASLIIGSIWFLTFWWIDLTFPIPTILGIIGLTMGIMALRRNQRRKIAIAGIVLSSIEILHPVIGLIV